MSAVENKQLFDQVEKALEQIRPFLLADGGDVSLVEITPQQVAKVKFHGSCRSCNMAAMTLKAGVEETVIKAVPDIKSVVTAE